MTSLELKVLVAAVFVHRDPDQSAEVAMDRAERLVKEAERRWYAVRGLTGPDDPKAREFAGCPH